MHRILVLRPNDNRRRQAPLRAAVRAGIGLILLWPGTAATQQAALGDALASPALQAVAGPEGAAPDAVAAFWRHIERTGAPLIEPDPAVEGHSIVTFVARAGPAVERVRLNSLVSSLLVGDDFPHPDSVGWMHRLGDTDVWYLSFRLRDDARFPYSYEIHRPGSVPEPVLDPFNGDVWEPEVQGLRASILELPDAPPQPWRNPSGEEGVGDWDELSSDDEPVRSVYVYKPLAWDPDRAEPYPVLIGLGAFGHGIGMRVDRMVDALIEAGRLPPLVVALVDLAAGDEDARYGPTADFILDELLPYLRSQYGVGPDPGDVVVSGTSRRGMVAALLAFEHPDAFGNVLSLSGSYYWRPDEGQEPEWLPRRYAAAERRPIRLYLAAGALETWVTPTNRGHYLLATNRRMRDVLRARDYPLRYVEFNGVHSELSWADGLAEGLIHFLGPRGAAEPPTR